jgi:outer membrane receptor protein involved in Fe transport
MAGVGLLRKLLTIVFVSGVLMSHAQHSVKGRVENLAGEPLMGNAVVFSTADSGFVKGTSFLEGDFEVSGLTAVEAWVKLSSIEFSDTTIHVVFGGHELIDIGTIVVNNRVQLLAEVEVTATREMFQARPDGVMQVNVANTVLATSSSVSEILGRSPGIITTDEGLSVFGKGAATIYLNGKRIPPERVAAIPTNQVKSIEIISNPPASYNADGQAVINIITIDDLPEGYKVTAQQQASWSKMAGATSSTMISANYRKGKFDLFGNYDLRLGNDSELLYTTRVRADEKDYLSSKLRWDQHRKFKNYSNYTAGLSYDLGGKAYASIEYNGSYQNALHQTRSTNYITTASEDGLYSTDVTRDALIQNNALTFNLNLETDTLGSTFFIGGQVSKYTSALHDNIDEDSQVNASEDSKQLQSNQQSDILVASPQADFIKVFKRRSTLSIGAKLSYARTSSGLRFYEFDEGQYRPDTTRSNDFEYIETIPAAYLQFESSVHSISYALGVRSELTRYILNTTARGHHSSESSYLNIFPNIQVAYKISGDLNLRLAYTSRINRPSYQSLSPMLIYQDAFTSSEGNPNLMPEKIHSVEGGATYKNLDFKAGYSYKDDPLDGAALRGADNKSYVLKNLNFDRGHSWFSTVTASFSNKWITSVNTLSVTYGRLIVTQYDYEKLGETPQAYGYSSNKINVNNWFTIHVLGWHLGGRYISTRYVNSMSLLTLGVEREFLNKSLKCSFTANDIFHSNYPAGRYIVGETDIVYNRWFNTSYFRFAIIYNFGKLKKASYRSKGTGEVENNRAR